MSKAITTLVLEEETIGEDLNTGDSNCGRIKSCKTSELKVLNSEKQTRNDDSNFKRERNKSLLNVTWDKSTIDNEMMNKKKSKKCCIYHKKREFGESSSEDECSSEDDHYKGCNKDNNGKTK
ncbi:hypothetical protein FG386_000620 [Cryptosporidium ryanae]|uniref:uncharacterized protein n=1 Tax=Cryptosporidium ryanae TaxID=515981 RepID=UPI00351A1FC8|nr:hypothetical protein FG386_000620 [Cryptosporidium ryanae]